MKNAWLVLVFAVGLSLVLMRDRIRDDKGFRKGYEQGTADTAAHIKCTGLLPSAAWRKKAIKMGGTDGLNDCARVAQIEKAE